MKVNARAGLASGIGQDRLPLEVSRAAVALAEVLDQWCLLAVDHDVLRQEAAAKSRSLAVVAEAAMRLQYRRAIHRDEFPGKTLRRHFLGALADMARYPGLHRQRHEHR